MKARYLLAAAAAMLVSGTAQAQQGDWRTWATTGEGDREALMMVDAATVTKAGGNTAEATTASYFAVDQKLGDATYSILWIRYRFDCSERTYQIIGSAAWYREAKLLQSNKPLTVNKISAGSLMDRLATAACSNTVGEAPRIAGESPEAEGRRYFGQ